MKKVARWVVVGWFGMVSFVFSTHSNATQAELTLPNKLVATAEFRQGDPKKPVVVVLHGFLQTHHFPTITSLTDGLSGEGYSVLAPTLSLGVTHRAKSMPCEAVNTHSIESTAAELNEWVKWLKGKGFNNIVIAGHSQGNVTNMAYLSSYPDASVKKFIGVSIAEGRMKLNDAERAKLISSLRAKVKNGVKDIQENQFSFCQKYRSTPQSIFSYLDWGPDKILAAIGKTKVPATMIMGSKDDRLGPDWTNRLQKTRAKVIVIDGANHFMDGQYEFDLIETVLKELKGA